MKELKFRVWDKSAKQFVWDYYLSASKYSTLLQRDQNVYRPYTFKSAEGHEMIGAWGRVGVYGDHGSSTAPGFNATSLLAVEHMHGNRRRSLIVEEYVGIADHKGREICDGDILCHSYEDKDEGNVTRFYSVVGWNTEEARWELVRRFTRTTGDGYTWVETWSASEYRDNDFAAEVRGDTCIIVGNIHQDAALFEWKHY